MYEFLQKSKKCAAVLSNWTTIDTRTDGPPSIYISTDSEYEGTIIGEKSIFKNFPYGDITRSTSGGSGEDTICVQAIRKSGKLAICKTRESALKYLYFIHSTNTCSDRHFEQMKNAAEAYQEKITPEEINQVKAIIN